MVRHAIREIVEPRLLQAASQFLLGGHAAPLGQLIEPAELDHLEADDGSFPLRKLGRIMLAQRGDRHPDCRCRLLAGHAAE